MDRLTPQSASFLHAETGHQLMHVGSVAVFEGPPPSYDEIRVHLDRTLPLMPRFRQKIRTVPLQVGRPVWVDDPEFLLRYHLRHTGLPRPGSDEQLQNLVGRLSSRPLDRTRPMWEMYVVEHLAGDRWAVVIKTHQAMVDGVSGSPLQSVLLSTDDSPRPPVTDLWMPRGEPSGARLVLDAMTDLAIDPGEMWRAARAAYRGQRAATRWVAGTVGRRFRRREQWGSPSLHGPLSRDRRWSFAEIDLDAIRRARSQHGVGVNDVIVALVTSGFRELLLRRGEMYDDASLTVLLPVPVSDESGRYENEITVVSADLPVAVPDPGIRLQMVAGELAAKVDRTVTAELLSSLHGYAPPLMLALGTRMATRAGRYQTDTQSVLTNVPGPQEPRFLLGRRMLQSYPVVPLHEGVHITVGAMSYDGRVAFGVTGDYDSCPDLDVMTEAMGPALADLLQPAFYGRQVGSGQRF
jgi:WS/DGAT/MGAT family acyltransferase